jgi:uncharacterized protein YyaL (SSP411 family)
MSTQTLNALSKASSSYLRSAMHQPIHWHEWGQEAFALAQRENKPILLDIGAVWCHWCHVMDRESYDDADIAHIVNERFVAVKVDRDERPDIDSRYQIAVSAISGQGGWPLTAFLTSDGKPFYGGTYFPPQEHYGRPSFRRVLLSISDAYREKGEDVAEQARLVEAAIAKSDAPSGQATVSSQGVDDIVKSAVNMFDSSNGGFGNAPKFPHPSILDLLIDRYSRTKDDRIREIFTATLEKMAHGGVYDQLAGGFHRYSVDEHWIVPHFEKMSYDNSELLKNYVHAYQVTGSEFFAQVARDIIRWMNDWLSDQERGGFYASQDADYSMDDDGDYFTWTLDEAKAVLSDAELDMATLHYDINEVGEMHHNPAKNVLYVRASVEETAKRLNTSHEEVRRTLDSAKQKMYAARLQRPTPYVDKTMYTGWNAMCVSAYLQAAAALQLDDARHFALRSLDRILSEAWSNESALQHVIEYSDPKSEKRAIPGMLEDYAFTGNACLDGYEATADLTYYRFAERVAEKMLEKFWDAQAGGFFDSQRSIGQKLGVLDTPRKPFQDSPTPAGNPAAAILLLRLHAYNGNQKFQEQAVRTLALLADKASQYGIFAATYGIAATMLLLPHSQVVILGEDEEADRLHARASGSFRFGQSRLRLKKDQAVAKNLPPNLAETLPNLPDSGRKSVAVVCSGSTCRPPTSDPDQLAQLLQNA